MDVDALVDLRRRPINQHAMRESLATAAADAFFAIFGFKRVTKRKESTMKRRPKKR